MTSWTIQQTVGPAGPFHQLDPLAKQTIGHEVWIHRVDGPAVVLGSTQRLDGPADGFALGIGSLRHVDGRPVELCRRRSGGGLVVIEPETSVWVDVIVPRASPLHADDVSQSFLWFGSLWAETFSDVLADAVGRDSALDSVPTVELAVPPPHRRAADRPFHCFAGLGHGEVLVGGNKVVGLSQRRTRSWTRLQALAVLKWDGAAINSLLEPILEREDLGRLGAGPYDAEAVAAGLPQGVTVPTHDRLVDGLLSRLPSTSIQSEC